MAEDRPSGVVGLLCDGEGTILEILRDEVADLRPGGSLLDLMDAQSRAKALHFLGALREGRADAEWEMNVRASGAVFPMVFAGGAEGGRLLVVGGESRSEVLRFYDDLMRMNNEHVNTIRALIKDRILSERRRESEQEPLYDDLSRLNNELVNARRELTKKNAELERLNEQKNVLLGMAAHDLRSPLSVIRTYASFLKEDAEDGTAEERRTFAETIERTSRFMVDLIDDTLDLSAIESGKLVLHREPVDLEALVRAQVSLQGVIGAPKGVTFACEARGDIPPLNADGPKLEQVLANLLGNAAKFSPPGSAVRVTVGREGGEALVAVADQGPGMTPEDLAKLFQPFGKTMVKPTAGEKSTGLGLAIARRIIRGHGGDIAVESVPGEGTTFTVRLPLVKGGSGE